MTRTNMHTFFDIIENYELTGATVLDLFLQWNGTQILTDDFIDHVKQELFIAED